MEQQQVLGGGIGAQGRSTGAVHSDGWAMRWFPPPPAMNRLSTDRGRSLVLKEGMIGVRKSFREGQVFQDLGKREAFSDGRSFQEPGRIFGDGAGLSEG